MNDLTLAEIRNKRTADAAWQLCWEWLESNGLRWDAILQPVRDELIVGFTLKAERLNTLELLKLAREWNK